jgi:hypothetical protein
MEFMLEHPLAGDDVGTRWPENEAPRVVLLERIELTLHRLAPVLELFQIHCKI